jgi:hypothetical protein
MLAAGGGPADLVSMLSSTSADFLSRFVLEIDLD